MAAMTQPSPTDADAATTLAAQVARAGYYPELVLASLNLALGAEEVVADLVQSETTFGEDVHRHVTVMALTATRLVIVHVDDVPGPDGAPGAVATSEAVPVSSIRSVVLTRAVTSPADAGGVLTELTIAVAWGAVRRLDLEPASCPDPACKADPGLTGTSVPEDVVIRVAAGVEGAHALARAEAFARSLSAATARSPW